MSFKIISNKINDDMGFKFGNSDKLKEDLKKMFPEPFPEIEERLNLPAEKLVKIMRNHIRRIYKNGGIKAISEFRNECLTKRQQVELRLNKELSHDNETQLSLVIGYFDMFIAQIDNMESDLIREEQELSDGRAKYTTPMKEEAEKYYREHKKEADKMPSKTWIEKKLIPHLEEKFNKDDEFFVESTIRKNWLNLTA